MTALISTRDLVKRFGDVTALAGVTLDIHAGECVGLLGPNGAGKTTLLSLVEGLRTPTSGEVRLFGGDPRDASSRVRLGSTPQATALPDALRVSEVLDFVASHFPHPAPRSRLVDEFDLGPLLRQQCGGLSGGQQRRVAVALAFAGDPDLVLLDEPTTGLDVDARRALWDAVRARHAAGCAVVVTSHHLEEIEQLAHRVVVIDDGVVRTDDTLAAVVSNVSRRRVTLRGVSADDIRRLDPEASVTTADDAVTAVVGDSDALVRSLVAADLPFRDLAVRGATLEEAFLTLTATSAHTEKAA
ncbi:ABC transporter ATP-binding protein [Microbacterium sp. AISO3]|uniref:ABC-2 type transport system ATP-binding protein n=2 Tax=Microbacterium TaxID=33882 RepID=A0ABU1HW34_9MICO|nr:MULTISPECIES: ABC transporter ATP-binding protein [Microbacterium]APF33758.1 ABC transporter ATP-binding protein [Microbacterium paludicola]MDR6165854.1 ABC-2 type transport system ATP-binding protein [Microbacterium paludicola]OAZ39019.1 ABC transporter ATP-binding protein [Microbacterium arborescens]OWP21020.1 ABC transporter ATP-binding protein [Microbacterium sp. AISO3]POX67447.1 ABC transporter ATP-binding protein [Microbacterium sp. Ru50]